MQSKAAVFKALDEGKKLVSKTSGMQYMLIEGTLHSRSQDRTKWEPSGLSFFNPASWLNLEEEIIS